MQTKGIINEKYKSLITLSSDSPNYSIIQDDVCIILHVDCDAISVTTNTVIPAHKSDPTIATPSIPSFVSTYTPQPFHSSSVINSSFSSQLGSIEVKIFDKIMAMKSFFMDELQTIKNELLNLQKSKTLQLILIMVQ